MVKGFGGKYGTVSKFKLEAIPDTTLRKALEVVHLSDQLISIQKNYLAKHQSTTQVVHCAQRTLYCILHNAYTYSLNLCTNADLVAAAIVMNADRPGKKQ
jgi:hypothetical protein